MTGWRDDALCRQTDPNAFHPEVGGSTASAKRTCMACEVRRQCLDYALAAGETHGVWGGLGPRERQRLRRTQAA
ncbi:WhiB family transcriptional regulator [Streptomyces sp. NBC_00101]|uniref:WhiB family transcriptional regulator n=1 Tax=Streptomyces sp. NBC_00101 TaxID=2975651 RepID=UPI003247BF20